MTPREGCWTDDPTNWRGKTRDTIQPAGFRDLHRGTETVREQIVAKVTTAWLPMPCGRMPQQGYDYPGCRGCAHDKQEDRNGND